MNVSTLYDINASISFLRKKDVFKERRLYFSDALQLFDKNFELKSTLETSLVSVNGKDAKNLILKNKDGEKLEEYYKWQFVFALMQSGLYNKEYICVECYFPKGNANSKPIKFDLAIFRDPSWKEHYQKFWRDKQSDSLDWLRENLIAVGEFKRNNYGVEKAFKEQLKPAMKEKEPGNSNIMGIFYDSGRLYLFQRKGSKFIRLDESKNQKGDASGATDLNLHLPDPYISIPDFDKCSRLGTDKLDIDRSGRNIFDLDLVTTITNTQIQDALSHVLRQLDKVGMVNQRGYQVIIHALALKIYDEFENERSPNNPLKFYITDDEQTFLSLSDDGVANFVTRMIQIEKPARRKYKRIFSNENINWKNENHVRAAISVCQAFQDYSFIRSVSTDLYQLVFYNFASAFKRDEAAQFLTPIPIIRFIVSLVNPRGSDTVFDPCVGIGDFLALSYLNSKLVSNGSALSDGNLYGVDLDESMISLATLNLLLAGDGEAQLFHKAGYGSINSKVGIASGDNKVSLITLDNQFHKSGNWDSWKDETELFKFDCILTNPPFGEDRAFRPSTQFERALLELYETWGLSGTSEAMDLGVLFLENAYRCLEENGRLGIVLSNSIASVQKWQEVRMWFAKKMRIVGIFDLPSSVFAETGVNTSILVAYKPSKEKLEKLVEDGYEIFCKDIQKVGYERRTRKRNVYFNELYRLNPNSFEPVVDKNGRLVLDEEFSSTVAEFKDWAQLQEEALVKAFLK